VLCVGVSLVVLWCLYSLRLQNVESRLRLGMQERLAERERIARELHDTILQSTQGLVFRFQTIANLISPTDPARQMMEQALDSADDVLAEGRERVMQLRSSEGAGDLPRRLEEAARRILADTAIDVRVVVEGAPQMIMALVSEELARIAEEFLSNTLRHARARHVDIELRYERSRLSMRIADDGIGIDPSILARGSVEGHFGLPGMRERAVKIGGALVLSSQPGAGVEVGVVVPAHAAYAQYRSSPWRHLSHPHSAQVEGKNA
jgi:signal transduction histidine kinase